MRKLDCQGNQHPLQGDFAMYYRETYLPYRDNKGNLMVMFIRDVMGAGNQRTLADLAFNGRVFGEKGVLSEDTAINASDFDFSIPQMGYRMLGDTPVYTTYNIANRTNRRGFNPGSATVVPIGVGISRKLIWQLFNDEPFPGRLSRDCVLHNGVIHWKGDEIGSFDNETLRIKTNYQHLKEYVCKLLARSWDVKTVEIVEQ